MERVNNDNEVRSSVNLEEPMGFPIDLNKMPVSSPPEAPGGFLASEASLDRVSVCSVCRTRVPAGRRVETAIAEQREDWKCLRCLLKNAGNDNSGSSRGGGGATRSFDINASPPIEGDTERETNAVGPSNEKNDGDKMQAFPHFALSSQHATTTQLNSMTESIGHNLPKNLSVVADLDSSGSDDMSLQKLHSVDNLGTFFRGSTFDEGLWTSHSTPEYSPQSPNMLYLQTLRKFIAERKGVLGEGWKVEFEFCYRKHKTSAIYIAPDGSRMDSMEDVARHLGLSLRSCSSQNFLTGSGSGSHGDCINDNFPIQFQDFCLLSAGNVDPRPSYHNTNQIWPVGYRCSWHDRITGSLFACEVADGGEGGPIFKVQRYPCTRQSIPGGSTILSRTKLDSCKGDDEVEKDDLTTFQVVVDDSISLATLLTERSPPCLDNCASSPTGEGEDCNSKKHNSSKSDMECLPQRTEYLTGDIVGLSDIIGEFQVEGRSTLSVWEMVSQAILYACHETFKQKGVIKFFCGHDVYEINNENLDSINSLSRYSYFGGPINIPFFVWNENEFHMTCEMLVTWLKQDRFGLDADFVQEIIEQLPGVSACSDYNILNDRKQNTPLQTLGSGFFQAERKSNSAFGYSKLSLLQSGGSEDILKRDPCPPGKPLGSKLPSYLIGDVLQVWELVWRFLEVLGLGQPFSFQELEFEIANPWLDIYPLNFGPETRGIGGAYPGHFRRSEKFSQATAACLGRHTGLLLAKIYGSLLKLLVSELLSRVAVYVCPNFDARDSKSRRGKKKDLECLAALKKTNLDVLPVNELTWPEITRRYILSVLSMEGNLDSSENAFRESGKIFHCLHGDGGILCGSLTGITALEADAVVLADAMKEVFGSLNSENEIVCIYERESHADTQTTEVNDGVIPDWAQVLEPVRKLPTNVGARIRRCVREALEKKPPEWAEKMLEHSISKEIYKGNASGPTKRAIISVLANVHCENRQQNAEKIEKVKIETNLPDLITKQCRIVLRHATAADEDRVFCNLLGKTILNPNDNDGKGLLGYPAMVSRPLDFRTIDTRLAAGAYCGSHEAFIDDVREVWRNIRTAYGDRSDLIDLADNLSKKFEDLYEKEVLTVVQKFTEFSNLNGSSDDVMKERDDLVAHLSKSSLPRASWDEGLCKVCGTDKDDDKVLLCDSCDSEYHRYCLNPPLLRIPEGNWYCPSCVAGRSVPRSAVYGSVANQCGKRYQGEFTHELLKELARLANLMEIKEYWEFTVEERIFFLKFLFDEALNTATIRDHMDRCASRTGDLQHKLRFLTSELKILKFKEEKLSLSTDKTKSGVLNGHGDLKSDASPSLISVENISRGNPSEKLARDHSQQENIVFHAQLSPIPSCQNELPISIQQQKNDQRDTSVQRNLQASLLSANESMPGHNFSGSIGHHMTERAPPAPVSSIHRSCGHLCSDQADMSSLQDSLKLGTVTNAISDMQASIASIETELLKVSLRKDFLGRDSNGRVYWVFYWPGARPWIVANGSLASKERALEEFIDIPDFINWTFYESYNEIEKLVGWLRENDVREKELRDAILQIQNNKLKEDSQYADNHILSRGEANHMIFSDGRKALLDDSLATKAMAVLERKFGSCLGTKSVDVNQNMASKVSQDDGMYRCECLELLLPSKDHCPFCHHNFATSEELRQHSVENCKAAPPVSKRSQTAESLSKCKMSRDIATQEGCPGTMGSVPICTSEKTDEGFSFGSQYNEPECPFNFGEIMARFHVPGSVKDAVNEIGLIGSGGIPSLLPGRFPYHVDPALTLGSTSLNKIHTDFGIQQHQSSNEDTLDRIKGNNESNRLLKCAKKGLGEEGSNIEMPKSALVSENNQVSSWKDKNSTLGILKSSIVRESSQRPLLAGRASQILEFLKINLLDMDAALPVDAIRTSRSNQDRRCAWRAFVKSARTIYEIVQATIILEDSIKSEYLRSDWWYWSSPSAAAQITTLSALSLRIYALDSAICYEEPLPSEIVEPNRAVGEESPQATTATILVNPRHPSFQKTLESDPAENPSTSSNTSKRRKYFG